MLKRTRLALAVATSVGLSLGLAGCGGSSATSGGSNTNTNTNTITNNNPPNASAASVSGVAQDGYLADALVCLDININGKCDSTEPTTFTDGSGNYTLTGATAAQIASSPILVEAKAGSTIDVTTGNPVSSDYTLLAPPGYTTVNPLTTMIAQQALAAGTISQGRAADVSVQAADIADMLFSSAKDADLLKEDYLAGQSSSSLTSAQQAALAKAADVGENMVTEIEHIISSTPSSISGTATNTNMSLAAVSRVYSMLTQFVKLPAKSTATEIASKVSGISDPLSASEIEAQAPADLSAENVSLASLENFPDYPTSYQDLYGYINSSKQAKLFSDRYGLTVDTTKNNAVSFSVNSFNLVAVQGTSLTQWNPSIPSTEVYFWSSSAGAFQSSGAAFDKGTLSTSSSGQLMYDGTVPVKAVVSRVKLDGLNVGNFAQRFFQSLTAVSFNSASTFPANTAAIQVAATQTVPSLSTVSSYSSAPSALTVQTASGVYQPSNGDPAKVFNMAIYFMGTARSEGSVILDSSGNIYVQAVDSNGNHISSLQKIGTYTDVPATSSMPEMYRLDLEDGISISAMATEGFGEPVMVKDGNGQYFLGRYQDAGNPIFTAHLVDDAARKAIVGAVQSPLATQ